jgi:DNA topoisomerase-1
MGHHLFPPLLDAEGNPTGVDPRECPTCHEGHLSLKLGRFGAFVGCSRYPECRHTRPLTVNGQDATSPLDSAGKDLGADPATGLDVSVKTGRFGPYVELGTGKTAKRTSIPKAFDPPSLTLDQALVLLSLPRPLGEHPETGDKMLVGLGRFGPYIQTGTKYHKLNDAALVLTLTLEQALVCLLEKPVRAPKTADGEDRPVVDRGRALGENPEGKTVTLKSGRFGPYVTDGKVNATLPRSIEPDDITLSEALDFLAQKVQKMLDKGEVPSAKPVVKKKAVVSAEKPVKKKAVAKKSKEV